MKTRNNPNNRNNLKHPNQGGFSLVELVFAMMFLTIIILGVVNLQTSSLGMLNGQKNQVQAHFLATQGGQIVKALGYGSVNTAFGVCADPAACYKTLKLAASSYSLIPYVLDEIKIGNQAFQRKIQIVSDATNLVNAYKIRSIVEWEDSSGKHEFNSDPSLANHVETNLIVF